MSGKITKLHRKLLRKRKLPASFTTKQLDKERRKSSHRERAAVTRDLRAIVHPVQK